MCGCEKWKTGCNHCEQLNTYPASKGLDNSSWNWEKKKKLFTGLDITIVTPSKWLANLVRQSYLKDYPIKVIYNGIDLEVFRPVPTEKIKEKYGFDNRPIVLGVANEWTPRKGLNDFIKLSKMEKGIQFVVVGLKEMQMKKLPNTIKGIERTNSRLELVGLYSLANVFFNPTYEDNFPSTNLEALACGTPVIAYDTGGCSEAIEVFGYSEMHKFGKIIKKISPTTVNIEEVLNVIKSTIKENLDNESSKKYINVNDIDIDTRLREYLRLYGEI
jgi:glycosyltransferase involved in cell wall biosynthesis